MCVHDCCMCQFMFVVPVNFISINMCLFYVFQRPGYTTMQQALEGLRSAARGENRQVVGGYIIEEVIGRGNVWSRHGTVNCLKSSRS